MSKPAPARGRPAESTPDKSLSRIAAAAIVLAALAAYSNSFQGSLVFDDLPAIVENPSLRRITTALSPPNNTTVAGRPFLNLSFALNYAWGSTDPRGYHLVNLVIHVSAALLLFGLVRRTLALTPATRNSQSIAFAGSIWWAVHPLQTESVTYVVQRAESLCGLLYLATLYCLLRGATSAKRGAWYVACILACGLGMATKEVMATAPLVALLYDRAFLAGSFRQVWQERRGLYAALATSWLLLAGLVLGTGGRSGSAGFHHTITPTNYAATQAHAILDYLRLSVWPMALVFDYGRQTVGSLRAAMPDIGIVAGLLLISALTFRRSPRVGFLAVAFFLILAPSSSVVPIATQTSAEHRMYLPLAAVTIGLACTALAVARRLLPASGADQAPSSGVAYGYVVMTLVIAALLGRRTWLRNYDYRTEASIWADTVAKVPENPRAWVNLARTDYNRGDARRALEELTKAVELDPEYADARVNRGIAYQALGAIDDARHDFNLAVSLEPDVAAHYFRRGVVNRLQGRTDDAIADYERALELQPDLANAWFNLANLYGSLKQEEKALECYGRAIEAAPQFANAWKNRAALLGRLGRYDEAIGDCTRAITLAPSDPDLYRNRSVFYSLTGREAEARRDLQTLGKLAAAEIPKP